MKIYKEKTKILRRGSNNRNSTNIKIKNEIIQEVK